MPEDLDICTNVMFFAFTFQLDDFWLIAFPGHVVANTHVLEADFGSHAFIIMSTVPWLSA